MEPIEKQHLSTHLSHPCFSSGPILRDMSAFHGEYITEEEVFRLDKARVVFANHGLLQHDFPQLRDEALLQKRPKLARLKGHARTRALEAVREDWLLDKAAYISIPQAEQTTVNYPIPVRQVKVKAFRPYHYGRALIMSVAQVNRDLGGSDLGEEKGLLDIKGVGVKPGKEPSFKSHSNGILNLFEAVREVLFQRLIDFIMVRNGANCRTVPNYAVIDAGFDRRYAGKSRLPAGILVRRAHRRPAYPLGIKDPFCREVGIERDTELLLRRYGITSSGSDTNLTISQENNRMVVKYGESLLAYSPNAQEWIVELTGFRGRFMEFDGMNLQFTREVIHEPPEPQIVDFGAFWYKTAFTNPLVSLVASRPVRLGEIIRPDDPQFVQPDPQVAPPAGTWYKEEETAFEKVKLAFADMQDTVTVQWSLAYREGRLTGRQLAEKMDEYLGLVPGWQNLYPDGHDRQGRIASATE